MSTQHEDQGTPKTHNHPDRGRPLPNCPGCRTAYCKTCDSYGDHLSTWPHPRPAPVTEVVVTNAPGWMTPQEVAERLKTRGQPMPRVTVDGVTREPDEPWDDGPGVNLYLPSLNDPRGRREERA